MIKIKTGIIQKVLTQEQFKDISEGKLKPQDINLLDTVKNKQLEDGTIVEYLPIKLSYKETDKNGNNKFVEDEKTGEKKLCYEASPTLNAYGKEMRILLDMDEYTPVKVAVQEFQNEDRNSYKVLCIQNQLSGKLE